MPTKLLSLVLAMIVSLALIASASSTIWSSSNSLTECNTMYFLNGIVIYNSTISEELVLETPVNISLTDGFEQVVEHLTYYNLTFNDTLKAFTFEAEANSSFEGLFISKVVVCSKPLSAVRSHVVLAAYNPMYAPPGSQSPIPIEVRENYTRSPHEKVVKVVVPAFENWFRGKFGIGIRDASLLGLAVAAARFVYLEYIKYAVGEVPRDIDEVIETRSGDCDDMSRVLVELLSYYGIPAIIVEGYVYIDGFQYNTPIENVTYLFLNNGPHAFTMAYIPELGWIPLDFLAGSFIYYPFIVEGYTRETAIPSKEVVEEFLNLHRALNATQVVVILSEKNVEDLIGFPITTENLRAYFNNLVGKALITPSPNITQAPESETPSTPITLTEQTLLPPSNTTITSPERTEITETRNMLLGEIGAILAIGVLIVGGIVVVYYVLRKKGIYSTTS